MNKTLLLIICDFLLLNLLALTRWDKVEPPAAHKPPVPEVSANTTRPSNDLADMLKLALEQEQAVVSRSLADPALYRDDPAQVKVLQARLKELECELAGVFARWEDLESRNAATPVK